MREPAAKRRNISEPTRVAKACTSERPRIPPREPRPVIGPLSRFACPAVSALLISDPYCSMIRTM